MVDENKLQLDLSTLLAVTRTRFAAERTLMSWIRTAFSMITFGFVLMKFFQFLRLQSTANAESTGATHLGIFLILLGILSLLPAMIEHRKALNELSKYDGKSRWSSAFVIGILVAVIGVYALSRTITVQFF